jgi:hypothetical protein
MKEKKTYPKIAYDIYDPRLISLVEQARDNKPINNLNVIIVWMSKKLKATKRINERKRRIKTTKTQVQYENNII